MHSAAPLPLHLPGAHSSHWETPAPLDFPAGHDWQIESPAALKVPERDHSEFKATVQGRCSPAGHISQVLVVSRPSEGHIPHDMPTGQIVAGQLRQAGRSSTVAFTVNTSPRRRSLERGAHTTPVDTVGVAVVGVAVVGALAVGLSVEASMLLLLL